MQKHKLKNIENIGKNPVESQTSWLLAEKKAGFYKKTSKNVEKSVFWFDIHESRMIK